MTTRSALEVALAERDAALSSLAEARAEAAALRLRLASLGESEPNLYPAGTAPGTPPLRYRVVDEVHARVKRVLAPLMRSGGDPGTRR